MERNRKYHLTKEDRNDSTTALFAPRRDGQVTRKVVRQSGSLEIIENGDGEFQKERSPSEASFRSWSRASAGSVPPRSDSSLSRRTMTPTKQIALQAVKRKEESKDPFIDNIDIDLDSVSFDPTRRRNKKWSTNQDTGLESEESFVSRDDFSNSGMAAGHSGITENNEFDEQSMGDFHWKKEHFNSKVDTTKDQRDTTTVASNPAKPKGKKKEDSSSDDEDDDSEEVKRRAPNELLMEFVDCLMKKDFPNADKLCKMILLYEPENPEALNFKPLIEEKMQLDAEAAAAEEEGGSDDDDEDDDDDDSDDSDDHDDDDDSDDSSSNDDSDEDDKFDENLPSSSHNTPGTSKDDVSAPIKGANSVRVWKPAS